jgi:predicted dienelactone hydrolase
MQPISPGVRHDATSPLNRPRVSIGVWRCVFAFVGACAACILTTFGPRADELEAGFIQLTLVDPVEGGPMPAIIVFPTKSGGGQTELGPFTIAARRDTTPAPGPFPLVVFSHGTGGSSLGHHDSLTTLARAGFVTAAVEHPRDNFRDDSGFGTDLQLIGRPHHIIALIDAVLTHPTIGPLIDRTAGFGMAGHSAGGYTGLLVAGAVPDFSLREAYRRGVPDDPLQKRADTAGAQRRKPNLQFISDPRVRAILLMAPALGYVFDRTGLAKVRVPVRVYRSAADEILPHPWNAERIVQMLPVPPEYQVIDGAGHFVFLAPCSSALASRAPQICADPPAIDRSAMHARLNAEMIEFFRRTLAPR